MQDEAYQSTERRVTRMLGRILVVLGVWDVISFLMELRQHTFVDEAGIPYPTGAIAAVGCAAGLLALLKIGAGVLGILQCNGRYITVHIPMAAVLLTIQIIGLLISAAGIVGGGEIVGRALLLDGVQAIAEAVFLWGAKNVKREDTPV